MIYKLGLIILIVFFLTVLVSLLRSRRPLRASAARNSRMMTWRSIVIITIIVMVLVFSLFL